MREAGDLVVRYEMVAHCDWIAPFVVANRSTLREVLPTESVADLVVSPQALRSAERRIADARAVLVGQAAPVVERQRA